MTAVLRLLALALVAALALAGDAGGAPPTLPRAQVPPGAVVRWPGEALERCGRSGVEAWAPLGGACWYPVDLLQAKGEVRIFRIRGGAREEALLVVGAYPYETEHITLKDDRQVELSAADLARSRREQAEVGKLWASRSPGRFSLPLSPPLTELPPGGRFGSRRFFNGQPRSPHSGADYRAAAGTPVLAVADGRVVLAADHFFSGKSVFIDHGDGLVSMSFHLSRIDVATGTEVKRGQPIGAVGATGRATGPHLHFALRWRGARIDPGLLLGPVEKVAKVSLAQ
ncbi:MAG TPA: M23 family metallopeptidase [Thermoanaerobaculia bacterium]|nr:M23 family metallopeptidase [Thermoanaerobaculia bacterium]